MKVTLYTTTRCPLGVATAADLDNCGIKYEIVDVEKDPYAMTRPRLNGFDVPPVVIVDISPSTELLIWDGYRPDLIEQL